MGNECNVCDRVDPNSLKKDNKNLVDEPKPPVDTTPA